MRLIGLDYGHKRVGVASTDESGRFAIPRATYQNDEKLIGKILELKEKEGVDKIVMGESRNLDGTPNPIFSEALNFKKQLEEKGIEVVFQPEVFTTVEARRLQGQTEMTDASAASLILKSYIDTVYNEKV